MSQLIKKLKATQPQNTFVTPDAAAKIISSSGQKSKRDCFVVWSVSLLIMVGLVGFYFFGFKKKNIHQASQTRISIVPDIKIAAKPLNVIPEIADGCEDFGSSAEFTSTYISLYQQGASLYVKDLPEFIPSFGSFVAKYLDPYLENYTQLSQQIKKIKRPFIAHTKTPPKPTSKVISLNNVIPIETPVQTPQKKRFQEEHNVLDDLAITATRLSESQQQHLEGIHKLLDHMQIESVREEGSLSRLKANGHIYHLNTLVSRKPRLTWIGIQHNELIFYDEYKQEYRKKIAQN